MKWRVFSLVAIGVYLTTLDSSIVNVALPPMMRGLNTSLTTIKWVMTIYLLTVSALLLVAGKLSDLFGRRWIYGLGFIIFTMGSLGCGLAGQIHVLITARAVQGIGAAMIMACSPALIVDIFPPHERGKALGLIGTVIACGLTSGPALAGVMLTFFSWHSIFLINVPIGLLASFLAFLMLPRFTQQKAHSFDHLGATLIITGLAAILIWLIYGQPWGYLSAPTLFTLATACACMAGFIYVERKAGCPILDLSLLKNRLFVIGVVSLGIHFACLFSILFLMPFFLSCATGYSAEKTGYMFIILFAFLFILGPLSGSMSDRLGARWLCFTGMLFLGGALFWFSRLSITATFFQIAGGMGLAGMGLAIFMPPNNAVALGCVPGRLRGVAAGVVATARNVGMIVGVTIAGLIFNVTFQKLSGGLSFKEYRPELGSFFIDAFHNAMFGSGMLAGVGVVLVLFQHHRA
jgi:EmrB/QacA subfamily drug resistance transporter